METKKRKETTEQDARYKEIEIEHNVKERDATVANWKLKDKENGEE